MKSQDLLGKFLPLSQEKMNLLNSFVQDLSQSELFWLSGYFFGLTNIKSNDTKKIKNHSINDLPVTLISASQTGNARSLSKLLLEDFIKNKINIRFFNICDYSFKKIDQEKVLIFIVSTHGDGEPPEEAIEFYSFLFSNRITSMKGIYFSIFALGDKSYNLFCKAGKDIDNRLSKLNGNRLLDRVDADVDYIDKFKIWSKDLLNKIKLIKKNNNTNFQDKKFNFHTSKIDNFKICNKENPEIGTVLINQKITGINANNDVRHIEISFKNTSIKYKPGDAVGIWYENNSKLVKEILYLLKIKSNDLVLFKNNRITIYKALRKYFELTVNNILLIKKYLNFSNSKFLNTIINDNNKVIQYCNSISVVDMIRQNLPSKNITADQLITLFRPLSPRLYSISSSQAEFNDEIHITVKIVKYISSDLLRFGGCSGYLLDTLKKNSKINFFISENNYFRLPDDSKSIIMIGSGTGIAPFRAFMQQRVYNKAKGKNWIFFGNTKFTEDFLYQTEWQRYFKQGVLHKISLAWSRDSLNKIYVQDKIIENGFELWKWILQGAYIYICGDANKMAKDVELALLNVFSNFGNMNIELSKKFLIDLRSKKRYQRDIY